MTIFHFIAQASAPVFTAGEKTYTLRELFDMGGFMMWPILALAFVAVIVVFVCMWTTRSSAVLPSKFVNESEIYIRKRDYAGIITLCKYNSSSFARLIQAIMEYMHRNPRASMDEIREVAGAEGSRQGNILTRQISWLSDIGAIAPMLGLLGTVIGMMRTFFEISNGNFEGVKQMQMAGGVAEALITTAGGLLLGIPAMLAYVYYRSRIQKRITDMEVASTHIMTVIAIQMDRERRLGNAAQIGAAHHNVTLEAPEADFEY